MSRLALILILISSLVGCSSKGPGTIAELRQVEIVIDKENSTGNLDKAIKSYDQFLKTTKDTSKTPEAIRRLADLKVEKEYGLLAEAPKLDVDKAKLALPEKAAPSKQKKESSLTTGGKSGTSSKKRKTAANENKEITGKANLPTEGDLKRIGAQEAVALYRKLLDEFPEYERTDQTLYQLSRAYEEQGQLKEAIQVMNRLALEFPGSRHLDEVQFRRGEYFFARRKYLDAQMAYGGVVGIGEKSDFYARSLYKLGWSLYKQDIYDGALDSFFALLDYRAAENFNFANIDNEKGGKRTKDTLRSISQSFSSLGGVSAVIDYFSKHGSRVYEDVIYANLAEYYFSKQRYSDAVTTYTTFVERNPFHRQAPLFAMKVIAVNKASGFPSLVVKAKKVYAGNYAFGADYWKNFNPDNRPEVVEGLKTNLIDLSNHYHALYQNKRFARKKPENLKEATHWYREFLRSFPMLDESPSINYQLAELLLESSSFAEAAQEYEKTAYEYPFFEEADKAGYAAVYASRQYLKQATGKDNKSVKRYVIRLSLKFANFFPKHEKVAIVLAAAVDDLYVLQDFKTALIAARNLIESFPDISKNIRRSALLVAAHSSFELEIYSEAEAAYTEVLQLLPDDDASRGALVDNLVASIYKQGEVANSLQNYKQAADHFLRVAIVAPASKLRPTAEYDGAVALIKVEEWQGAATVLANFRKSFPKHELQQEVTKKLAYVYREDGRLNLAAVEFERIEIETTDPALSQEALMSAAELYEQLNRLDQAEKVYRRYVGKFPEPVDINIETRNKLAIISKEQGHQDRYLAELNQIVTLEAAAGAGQTGQTRHIAGMAAIILTKLDYDEFISVRLVRPFKENLQRKQLLMKKVTGVYSKLFEYEDGEVAAAATFYLAEIYADFSVALLKSERPEGLSALELEEYELALEEQAYPFEEKAIETHQNNVELMAKGIYNDWIDNSLEELAIFIPARYAKMEAGNSEIARLAEFRFENITLNLIAQAGLEQAVKVKTAKNKSNSDKKKSVADVDRVSIYRLGKGLTGFVISENYQFNFNQKDLFVLGIDALESGVYDVAVDCFKPVTEMAPLHSFPYVNLAIAYIRSDRDEQAEEPLKKVLQLVAGHPLASHEYGLLLRRAGRFVEARAVYEDSLAIFPEYFPLRKNLGVLCDLYMNDLECASRQYKMFLEAQPEDEQVKLWLAELQGRRGR